MKAFAEDHHSNHDYEVLLHGQRVMSKAEGTAETMTQVANRTEGWDTFITPGRTPSPTFASLIRAIFAHFDGDNAEVLQPHEFCAFMLAMGWSSQEFPPIQVLLSDSPSLSAALHECDTWLANWYRSLSLEHRMGTRQFSPPPPVQPCEGRIRLRDQFINAIMHPPAPIVPGAMPLLIQQGLDQYFMSSALRAPQELFARLGRLMGALGTQLEDPKTGRTFSVSIPRSCLPMGPDPEEEQKRMTAETQARMWQVEAHARQVAEAQRRMEADHIVNEAAAQVYFNVKGGWIIDASGNRTYKHGYL